MDINMQELLMLARMATTEADELESQARELLEEGRPLLARALKLVFGSGMDLLDDMDEEVQRLQAMKAKNTFRQYQEYAMAGFSKEQAFTMVLASIKPTDFSDLAKSVGEGAKRVSQEKLPKPKDRRCDKGCGGNC